MEEPGKTSEGRTPQGLEKQVLEHRGVTRGTSMTCMGIREPRGWRTMATNMMEVFLERVASTL